MRIIVSSFLILLGFISVSQNNEFGINYRVELMTDFAEENAMNPDETSPERTVDTLRASLTDNSSFSVAMDTNQSVYYDFYDQLIYHYSNDSIFNISSLFSIVAYRVAEFENRRFLSEILSQSGANKPMGNAVDIEVIFGLENSENSVRTQISKKTYNDTTSYEYMNSIICKIHYSSHLIAQEYKKSMQRLLVYCFTVHPIIKEDILKTGLIPDFIYVNYNDVGRNISVTHTLIDCGMRIANDIETGLNEKPIRISNTSDMNGLTDSVFYHRLSNSYSLPDSNVVYKAADKLCSEGKYLSAMLCVFEYILSTGNQSIGHIKPILAHQDDADITAFLFAMAQPENKEEAYQCVAGFDKLIAKKLEYGSVLNIYAANYIMKYDTEKAIEYFHNALYISPGITNAWFDLGRIYANMYDFNTAWQCFEIVFRTGTPKTNKADVQKMKRKFKIQYPEYF